MQGTTNVVSANSYVIIHRMHVVTKGTNSVNVGNITATAVSPTTITAMVLAGQGQTQMAIYGIPSTQKLYISALYASANKTGPAGSVDITLLVNPEPNAEITQFLVKHTLGLITVGTSSDSADFYQPKRISGPAIIKVQGNASALNFDVSAGFNAYLVNN